MKTTANTNTTTTTSFATTMIMLLGLQLLILCLTLASVDGASTAESVVGVGHDDGNVGGRDIVSFDFNWKFRKGLTGWPESDEEEPPINTDPGLYPPEAAIDYDGTSNWLDVQLPHDGLIASSPSQKACPNGCSGRSYLPRNVLWYRKGFTLPPSWTIGTSDSDNYIYLEFDGSFRNTTIWINGQYVLNHLCGYTPFRLRLDNVPSVIQNYHSNKSNSITVFVDPDNGDEGGRERGSGWWYEGGGLYRHVRLIRSHLVHIEHDGGLFVSSNNITIPPTTTDTTNSTGDDKTSDHKAKKSNNTAIMNIEIALKNDGKEHMDLCFDMMIYDDDIEPHQSATTTTTTTKMNRNRNDPFGVYFNNRLMSPLTITYKQEIYSTSITSGGGTWKTKPIPIEPGESTKIKFSVPLHPIKLWTSSSPHLYDVVAKVIDCTATSSSSSRGSHGESSNNDGNISIMNTNKNTNDSSPSIIDVVKVYHGFRSIKFTPNNGFYLNKEHYKVRGFCDHDNFGVVGMAVPDRINLFRAQASRSIGGNGRRASHNPPDPSLLDIYDRLGIVVMDENRLFDNNTAYVENMKDLVKRDRNHPSIIIWSFCNELGCEGDHENGGPAFQQITTEYDGTRPTLANMFTFNDLLSNTIDIQGFSHRGRKDLDDCHAALPDKPIFMSECCSCNTMRSEDVGCETKSDNPHYACDQISFNARCLEQRVNASDGVEYAIGTMVWTLFDYYGEPPSAGLTVSSTYGQFDLYGFPKDAAFWFRTQWLLHIPDDRVDKTFPTYDSYEVKIVESWESPDSWDQTHGNTTKTIHAYSNAPFVELYVNDVSKGSQPVATMIAGAGSYAEWVDVTWEAGTLKAVARSMDGSKVAETHRSTCGQAAALVLSLDSPSQETGTGDALLLDRQDAALVRATIVDSTGHVVHLATNNVTFTVISGPGVIQGTGNGDPKSYVANDSPWHPAYHGLVRAVVRVTSMAAFSVKERVLLESIDGPISPLTNSRPESLLDDNDIVIEASSPGLDSVRLVIPTSTDYKHAAVLRVAKKAAGKPVNFLGSSRHQDLRAEDLGVPQDFSVA